MTKLPEREDGGIDWKRLWLNGTGDVCGAGKFRTDALTFARLVEAHTIERCAKVADEHCVFHESRAKSDTEAYGKAALDIRDTIRKLEV